MGIAATSSAEGNRAEPIPSALRAALARPTLEPRGWQTGLAPNAIALFLWIAFFDQIPRETLSLGGVIWPVLGAGLAGVLCYYALYWPSASLGWKTRRPLVVLATSTFGIQGATWVPGLLLTAVQVIWIAVSTLYGSALILRALVLLQLLEPKLLPLTGSEGLRSTSPLFLITTLLWCLAASFLGRYLVRVIAALMNVFPILPALLLGMTTLLAFRGLRGGTPGTGVLALPSTGGVPPEVFAMLVTIQMIFGFFTTAGLVSADWGTVARDRKDVKLGGWIGVGLAPWIVTTLAILTVAGARGRAAGPGGTSHVLNTSGHRYVDALESLVGGRVGGGMLLVFGLAALAPACYAAFVYTTRLHEMKPSISRSMWSLSGVALAWMLVVTGSVDRSFMVFSVLGALLAPVAGALAADHLRNGGSWPGPRAGYNWPGFLAWFVGLLIGIAPIAAGLAGHSGRLVWLQPAALYAFASSFLVYRVAAGMGMESPGHPIEAMDMATTPR
ncbi:MAG: hypothetical protein NVSMB9_31590 [Isosphaeraceae bacterium]